MPEAPKKLRPIEAVRVIFDTLEPLDPVDRERVLSSVLALIGAVSRKLPAAPSVRPTEGGGPSEEGVAGPAFPAQRPPTDIRSLKEKKKPRSSREMAALVAYYVAELAPLEDRKDSITAKDIEKYFKQAQYPMPQNRLMTLVNAKNAGYLEGAGRGKYKVSPVGYNLVVHGLPRPGPESGVRRERRARATKPKRRTKATPAGGRGKKSR